MQKVKTVVPPVNLLFVLKRCKERIVYYPVECREYAKIKQQIDDLERILNDENVS